MTWIRFDYRLHLLQGCAEAGVREDRRPGGQDRSARIHVLGRRLPTRRRALTVQIDARLRRSALVMTDTELRLMAAAAIIGLRSNPKNGYRTPAAIGIPRAL